MKLQNRLQEIYNASGHEITCDNRRYATKTINNILRNESVTLEIVKKGYVKKQKNGFRYNTAIRINGKGNVFRLKNHEPDTLLKAFAHVIEESDLRNQPHEGGTTCTKCNGKGVIEAFMHISQGICFDCLGIGYTF